MRMTGVVPQMLIIVIQEAGLDGFWIHRVLQAEGIESYVVDPASIATSRRRRRAKTDHIDGEALIRALLAYLRGEPRVCAMIKIPTPEEEDRRRITREPKVLIGERIGHVNRLKGLLFAQGISGYEPPRRDRGQRLDALRTGDGRALPDHLKAQIGRELDRLKLLLEQIKAVEAERHALLAEAQCAAIWVRHQPQSALARWFEERVKRKGGRLKRTTIVALAHKLLVALWKYVTAGVVIEGAIMKTAG